MKKTALKLSVFVLFITYHSCATWRRPLRIPLVPYTGKEVRTDGFYYNKRYWNFILYRNGVMYGSGADFHSLKAAASYWTGEARALKWRNNSPMGWGAFNINYPKITLDQWYGSDEGFRYHSWLIEGSIVNDSTMVLSGVYFERDTFRLYHLSEKPDSTNRFIGGK